MSSATTTSVVKSNGGLPFCPQAVRLKCSFNKPIWVKRAPHWEQRKGRSPVWTRRCRLRSHEFLKAFAHTSQAYGRSPVWVRWWRVTSEARVKVLPQSGHARGSGLSWMGKGWGNSDRRGLFLGASAGALLWSLLCSSGWLRSMCCSRYDSCRWKNGHSEQAKTWVDSSTVVPVQNTHPQISGLSQERPGFFGIVVIPCVLRDFKLLWCCRRALRSAGLVSDCMHSFSMDGAEVSHDTVCWK